MKTYNKDLSIAAIGFAASLLLTWLFIERFDGYISTTQMMLSGAIAGGKWAIQLLLAAAILGERRWSYFREMGVVSGIGSCMLIPYILVGGSWAFFLGFLILCVVIMAVLVVSRLAAIGMTRRWAVLWFALLGVAVSLQLTLVFDVI